MEKTIHKTTHESEIKKLNRAIGQLDGVKRMIDEKRYCIEILQQLKAARSAIRNIEQSVLNRHMQMCLLSAAQSNNEEEILKKIEELQSLLKNHN